MSNSQKIVLEEIISDLVDPDKSLVGPLMRLRLFSLLTKNEALGTYVKHELEGYQGLSPEILPDYRKSPGSLYLDLYYAGNMITRESSMDILEHQEARERLRDIRFSEGAGTLETTAKELERNPTNSVVHSPFPAEMYHLFEEGIRKLTKTSFQVRGARLVGNNNKIFEILQTVRSRLLEFTMAVAEQFGFVIEIESFNKDREQNNQTINYIMQQNHINTTGDGNVVNTGDQAQIQATITINKNDWDTLKATLLQQGIEEEDIHELRPILEKEQPDGTKLGEGTLGWIGKISGKAINGIGKIATSLTANLLAYWIRGYYGIGQ